MNFIVISGLDATNYILVNIVKELKRRGHGVFLYGKSLEYLNVNMFKGIADRIEPLEKLDQRLKGDVSDIDAVLCSNDTMMHVVDLKKYIFTYSITSIFGTLLSEGGDFMFASGIMKYEGILRENCAFMAVGNPKYSFIEENPKTSHHRFLFIDSGHYPFGKEGKVLLARLLLRICNRFPQYELVIKPRFLEGDVGQTHKNSGHLYQCIRECCADGIPDNLVMLKEYGDMNQLIGMSDTVLCMYTSAFIDVMVQGKGLIIIGNLPSLDSADMRNEFHWRIMKEECKMSGCLVDYREVLQHLPAGMSGQKGYLQRQLSYRGNSAIKVVDVMEYVIHEFITQGNFPKMDVWDCNTYIQDMDADEAITWEKLIENRKINFLNYHVSRCLDQVRHDMDIEAYLEWLNKQKRKGGLLNASLQDLVDESNKILNHIIVNNRQKLYGNPVSESYLIKAMFLTGNERLLESEGKHVSCNRTLSYYQAGKYLRQGNSEQAVSLYKKYLKETERNEFIEYVSDGSCYKVFPFHKVPQNRKILIYGAGQVGRKYGWQLVKSKYGELVGFVDRNHKKLSDVNGIRVFGIDEIWKIMFDYVVVAIKSPSVNQQVRKELIISGIEKEKIVSH